MATQTTTDMLRERYERAARRYLHALPLEHFMESTPQATQRKITLESLDLVAVQRDDFHVYNELLVQYPLAGRLRPGQVVPDNMVVIYNGALDPDGSYDVPLQPAKPFWVLEYVSKNNPRKDYVDNMRHYEEALQVPYYLLFRPDTVEMTLYRHETDHYGPSWHGTNKRLMVAEVVRLQTIRTLTSSATSKVSGVAALVAGTFWRQSASNV